MNKRGISISFIALTIGAIVAFQSFWLYKNYNEEKRLFTTHTNILFRESIFKLQASKLQLDTNVNFRVRDKSGVISITNELKGKIKGNARYMHKEPGTTMIFSMKQREPGDSPDSLKHEVFDFLVGLDSLQDSITVREVTDLYRQDLLKEGFNTPFSVTMNKVENKHEFLPPDPDDNKVAVGFKNPVIYQLSFENSSWYVWKRLGPQIFFSLLLIGVTVFSFLLLYRNWQQQRKLTQLKNDFISNITHELKTPIATVSVAIEALKNFNALQDPQRTKEYLDISGNELQRLSLLVDKVLKLSMFEKQEIELKKENFNMKALIDEVVDSMRLQFEKYHAQVALQTQGNNFTLNADKMHITSVIFNLLDNALKYSKANPSIRLELKEEPEQLILSVTDNGVGIAAEYKERIFEKFFRVPTGDKHNIKGYGLGLSYVAYVVQRQGGEVNIDSKEGIGSRFTIKIPKSHE